MLRAYFSTSLAILASVWGYGARGNHAKLEVLERRLQGQVHGRRERHEGVSDAEDVVAMVSKMPRV